MPKNDKNEEDINPVDGSPSDVEQKPALKPFMFPSTNGPEVLIHAETREEAEAIFNSRQK